MHELLVQAANLLGMIEDHLRDERPGLHVPATLELEEVALGADRRTDLEPLEQSGPRNVAC